MSDRTRTFAKFVIDLTVWSLATPLAFLLRLDLGVGQYGEEILALLLLGLPLKAIVILALHLPGRSWSKVGLRDLYALIQVVVLTSAAWVALIFFLPPWFEIPRSIPLINVMLAVLGLCGVRLASRLRSESLRRREGGAKGAKKVLIAGAGETGTMAAREMLRHPEGGYIPVGFLDDDPSKRRKRFLGVFVLGGIEDLPGVLAKHHVDEVLIALPSQGGQVVRRVVELSRAAKVRHRIIPGVYELLSGKVSIADIREVDIEDLLRREPVRLETDAICGYLRGRTVLVTGAGGSIGSEIVRKVALFDPGLLLLLGRGENSIYEIDMELAGSHPEIPRYASIVDVRDADSLRAVFERFRPEVVFHAAAHKHVPLMEANPDQAVFNNIEGARNLARLALEFGVSRFINISTDKAVCPTSVMGATKRVNENIVRGTAEQCRPDQAFVSVRFGNVLDSRGSVIPLFRRQIQSGGPVTVTHPEMLRYFMTIPEAAMLVLQAGSMAVNGRVYVLDMGEPIRIVDLAHDLIRLSGKEPGEDVEIVFTGIRPGEKLYEELLMAEEGTVPSEHAKIFVVQQACPTGAYLDGFLDELLGAAATREPDRIRNALKQLVPSYAPGPGGVPASVGEVVPAEGESGNGAPLAQQVPSITPLLVMNK